MARFTIETFDPRNDEVILALSKAGVIRIRESSLEISEDNFAELKFIYDTEGKVPAIKKYREFTGGASLVECKRYIDREFTYRSPADKIRYGR